MNYEDAQMNEMRAWFLPRYEEPVMGTPYEGEHVHVDGGPYDPAEVLQDEFGGKYSDDSIAKVVKDLTAKSGEWVKRQDFGS